MAFYLIVLSFLMTFYAFYDIIQIYQKHDFSYVVEMVFQQLPLCTAYILWSEMLWTQIKNKKEWYKPVKESLLLVYILAFLEWCLANLI